MYEAVSRDFGEIIDFHMNYLDPIRQLNMLIFNE